MNGPLFVAGRSKACLNLACRNYHKRYYAGRVWLYSLPEALLEHLKQIEVQLGREQNFRWGPRLIDLDILFYDNLVLDSPSLVIPHPRLQERAFVIVPLADVAPDYVHPVLRQTVRELLASVSKDGINEFQ